MAGLWSSPTPHPMTHELVPKVASASELYKSIDSTVATKKRIVSPLYEESLWQAAQALLAFFTCRSTSFVAIHTPK